MGSRTFTEVRVSTKTFGKRKPLQTGYSYKDLHQYCSVGLVSELPIERLQGVWPKIIPVAMEMPIFYVNFSSLNYPNLNDESLGPYMVDFIKMSKV